MIWPWSAFQRWQARLDECERFWTLLHEEHLAARTRQTENHARYVDEIVVLRAENERLREHLAALSSNPTLVGRRWTKADDYDERLKSAEDLVDMARRPLP